MPTDEELIARSEVLKDNFNTLLSGGFECDAKEYMFEELSSFIVFKIKNQTEISNLINDTFADSTIVAKYVPYFEKNGVYYTANGSGGLMGAGYHIFEYTVKTKTLTTANVSIDYIECYDEEIHDKISACKNNPWGDTSNITLDLINVNGKWLISSLDADISQGLIK